MPEFLKDTAPFTRDNKTGTVLGIWWDKVCWREVENKERDIISNNEEMKKWGCFSNKDGLGSFTLDVEEGNYLWYLYWMNEFDYYSLQQTLSNIIYVLFH